MASIKVFINEKFPRKNGECAVYLIVNMDYKSLKFNTGVQCSIAKWDKEAFKVKGKSVDSRDKNLIIEECMARMNDIFVRYRLQHAHLTAELLKNEWVNPSRRIDFYAFFEEALKERRTDIAPGTFKHHKSVIEVLKCYRKELAFTEINEDFIEKFGRWLKQKKGNDINTVHGKMRVLKTYLNIAIRKKIITDNPFQQVRLKKTTVNRVFLTSSELTLLWEKYTSKKLSESRTKVLRHFLFMCFTGVRISDLKLLKKTNIIGSFIVFNAYKTKNTKRDLIRVPLNKYSKKLIEDEANTLDDALFRTVSEQKMNEYIKEIAKTCNIHKELSNHCGRHTFATLWLDKTNDLAQLQSILGHSNITETMIYVHITDSGLKRQMKTFEDNVI